LVSFASISISAYELQAAVRDGDDVEALGAGSDLGWGLFGLTGLGTIPSLAHSGTSLVMEAPWMERNVTEKLGAYACEVAGCEGY
jgi:hypothetical protein